MQKGTFKNIERKREICTECFQLIVYFICYFHILRKICIFFFKRGFLSLFETFISALKKTLTFEIPPTTNFSYDEILLIW